jgi:selenocysteine-specific translation elongation factor
VNFGDGFILHSYEVDEENLRTLIKYNSVSRFEFLDSIDQLKQEMSRFESKGHIDGPVIIPIDHVFDVKGIGIVVMGVVKQRICQGILSIENHAKWRRYSGKVNSIA